MTTEITNEGTAVPAPKPPLLTREFATLMVTASVYFLATGAVNALLPKFVVDELGGTEATAGFVMGSAAFSALATRIWFGRSADRRGARRILALGGVLGAIAFVMLTLTSTLGMATASRLVLGASGAAMVTASTMLGIQLAPESRRSQAAALVLVSFHAGMGIGPLLAEWMLAALSYAWVWGAAAVISLLSAVLAMLLSLRPGDPDAEPSPMIHRNALLPGLVTFCGVFAFNGYMTFLPLYARDVGLEDAGVAFLVASATMVVIRVTLGQVPDIVGPIRAGSWALALSVAAAVFVAMWPTPAGVIIGAGVIAAGLSLQSPSFIAIAVNGVSDRERGSAMATFTASYDIAGAIIGPTLGLIIASAGYRPAFLLTAAMSVVGLVLLQTVVGPRWDRE